MKTILPTEKHKQARLDMIAALKAHDLQSMEMLALMSYTVGQLVALQDQRKVTPAMAMELVASNLELGNAHAIAGLFDAEGQA